MAYTSGFDFDSHFAFFWCRDLNRFKCWRKICINLRLETHYSHNGLQGSQATAPLQVMGCNARMLNCIFGAHFNLMEYLSLRCWGEAAERRVQRCAHYSASSRDHSATREEVLAQHRLKQRFLELPKRKNEMGKEVPVPSSLLHGRCHLNITLGGKTTASPREPWSAQDRTKSEDGTSSTLFGASGISYCYLVVLRNTARFQDTASTKLC